MIIRFWNFNTCHTMGGKTMKNTYISYHIISYHIISYHIISYHIIPYHTIPYTIPYHTIPYHTIPYHIISYHANPMPYHQIMQSLYKITSYHMAHHSMYSACSIWFENFAESVYHHLNIRYHSHTLPSLILLGLVESRNKLVPTYHVHIK